MSIFPLPVFETDANPYHRSIMTEQERRQSIAPPESIVVKFGYMRAIAEYPYDGDTIPACGTKFVARTHRGTELVEMLATACPGAVCSKVVDRQEMLAFIENSGAKDFPFHTKGQILRPATSEDLHKQAALESDRQRHLITCRRLIEELTLNMTLVDVEPILGGELLTFYYMAEERVDFRDLVRRLAAEFKTRIEMRQVGARDEARLVADYERCGQYCCCKSFLKVLKPVSMKAAKLQKATLDPLKISGRCGRLMCCLRYEDETYRQLKERLPRRNTRVGTAEGPGLVIDAKVIVQLVLVRLEHDAREIAVPVDELMDPEQCPRPGEVQQEEPVAADPQRGASIQAAAEKTAREAPSESRRKRRRKRRKKKSGAEARNDADGAGQVAATAAGTEPASDRAKPPSQRRSRRRRGRRRSSGGESSAAPQDRSPRQPETPRE
jgi:cell fate regulator YaaT (PSP1 superfamily)